MTRCCSGCTAWATSPPPSATSSSASRCRSRQGQSPPNGCIDSYIGGFFCAFLEDYLKEELGLTQDQINNGGLTIKTTLRPDMQAAGDQAVLNTLPMGDPLAGMYTAVEPGTGAVLAMSVNRRYGCTDPDCESVVLNDAYSQGAGSTYKTFVAAAALQRGFSQYYTQTTGDPYTSRVYRDGGRRLRRAQRRPLPGTLDLERALYMSSNTYFLALEDALGSVEEPVRMAEAMGMNFVSPPGRHRSWRRTTASFTFGPYPTSPLDLASAYNTLAANGTQCDPSPVAEILDRDGQPLTERRRPAGGARAEQRCTPEAISPGVASVLNQILRHDVEPGRSGATGTRAFVPGHQIAGKTGTSQENYSVAFVGYTPQYTASVMVLNPKRNQDVGGFGGGKGATIWHDAMAPILDGPADGAVPAGRPAGAGGQHQAGARPAVASTTASRRSRPRASARSSSRSTATGRPASSSAPARPPVPARCSTRRSRSRSATARTTWSPPPSRRPRPSPARRRTRAGRRTAAAAGTAAATATAGTAVGTATAAATATATAAAATSRAGGGPPRPRASRRPGRRRRPAPHP